MASRGFEFAYMVDGSNGTPLIKDMAMAADASGYLEGDLLTIDSNGRLAQSSGTVSEVSAVCMETDSSSVSNDDELKCAIVTAEQVWRCSMDASSTALKVGYSKDLDIVDENTIDADGSGGSLILFDTGEDDDGNVMAYVTFGDVTFGVQDS